MKLKAALYSFAAIWLIQGCSGEQTFVSSPQYWKNVEIILETRARPQATGMYEFLVVATNARRLPADDMIVSLRASESTPWRQAIQDGHTGVFRKALGIRASDKIVYVQLRRGDENIVLQFPLDQNQPY